MASKGGSRHLKRYAVSGKLRLPRKSYAWFTKPTPGPHSNESSIPIRVALRDYLSVGHTAREVDHIIVGGNVLVDGEVRREPKFPIGLMDVVQLPALNSSYRVLLDKRGRLILVKIPQEEASTKLCRVIRKQTIRGKKVHLTFHDGKTASGDLNSFKPGDVAKLELPGVKISERLPFEVGAVALVTGGSNVGRIGRISEIRLVAGTQPNLVLLKSDREEFQAPEHYVFVVGKEKPSISLPGEST